MRYGSNRGDLELRGWVVFDVVPLDKSCPAANFAILLSWKCSIASGKSEDRCGPCATASHISAFVHGFPVHIGHPNVAYSLRRDAAG